MKRYLKGLTKEPAPLVNKYEQIKQNLEKEAQKVKRDGNPLVTSRRTSSEELVRLHAQLTDQTDEHFLEMHRQITNIARALSSPFDDLHKAFEMQEEKPVPYPGPRLSISKWLTLTIKPKLYKLLNLT